MGDSMTSQDVCQVTFFLFEGTCNGGIHVPVPLGWAVTPQLWIREPHHDPSSIIGDTLPVQGYPRLPPWHCTAAPRDPLSPFSLAGDRLRQTENRATRCKVERLQLLLQQKRLRRKARRDARAPYHWVPNRKAGRTNSNSSVSSEGSLDLDFEDSVWKPEVKAEMKSEFVVA